MTFEDALCVIRNQSRNCKRFDGLRFTDNEYEYRLRYEGGFAMFFAIERREIGRRNFKYLDGFAAWDMDRSALEDKIKVIINGR